MSVLKKLLNGIISVLLLSICAFFVAIIAYLVDSEVSPALENGSLNVETSTMILNRVWEGNEIYVLLAVYTLLACVSGLIAYKAGRKVLGK